jgi:hypothetical protein
MSVSPFLSIALWLCPTQEHIPYYTEFNPAYNLSASIYQSYLSTALEKKHARLFSLKQAWISNKEQTSQA